MSSAQASLLRQGLINDGITLAQLAKELDAATASRNAAKDVLDDAQTTYAMAELNRQHAKARHNEFKRTLLERRASARDAGGLTLHTDILSLIFLAAMDEYHIPDFECVWLTSRRTRQRKQFPYVVAQVSKTWRAVALSPSCSSIWSYLSVPGNIWNSESKTLQFTAHMERIIQRSRRSSLDIVIRASVAPTDDSLNSHFDFYDLVFDHVLSVASRIRTLDVQAEVRDPANDHFINDRDDIRKQCAGLMRFPTPTLEEALFDFLIVGSRSSYRDLWEMFRRPIYLPNAPHLRKLKLENIPILPGSHLPALETFLLVNAEIPADLLHNMLNNCPALVTADLHIDSLMRAPSEVPHLSLPITTLKIGGQAADFYNGPVAFPNLTTLQLSIYDIGLAQKAAKTLTALVVTSGHINGDELSLLAGLTNLECAELECDFIDHCQLVERMCSHDEPMWPRLKTLSVHMWECCYDDGGEAFLHLVQTRRERVESVSPLQQLTVRNGDRPARWVVAKLRELMGENFVENYD